MFKYNVLSDLKDGSLVTPLRKEGTFIVCELEDNTIINKKMSDFDFNKKVEDRGYVLAEETVVKMEEDLKEVVIEKDVSKIVPMTNARKNIKINVETQVIRGIK